MSRVSSAREKVSCLNQPGGRAIKVCQKVFVQSWFGEEVDAFSTPETAPWLGQTVQRINRIDADNCETLIGDISRGRLSCWVARHLRHFRLHSDDRACMRRERADCELPQMEHVLRINHRPFIPPQLPIFTFLSLHYRGELRVGRPPLRAETDVKWFRAITFVLISAFCNLTARVMSNRNARLKSKCAIIQPVGTVNSRVPQSAPEGAWAIILLSCKFLSRTKGLLLISNHKARE